MNELQLRLISKWIIKTVCGCICIYLILSHVNIIFDFFKWIFHVIKPLLIGGIIAFLLNILVRFIENICMKKKFSIHRSISILSSLLLTLGLIIILLVVIVPELFDTMRTLVEMFNHLLSDLSNLNELYGDSEFFKLISSVDINWNEIQLTVNEWVDKESAMFMQFTMNALKNMANHIVTIFVGFIFSIYVLANKGKIKRAIKYISDLWLPQSFVHNVVYIYDVFLNSFHRFVVGQIIEAIILGSLCFIGMKVLNLPYSAMISTLIGVTALIPYFGAMIGMLIGIIMILTVSPFQALVFIIFITVLQQIEGNLIYPKVVGSKMNLPAILVFVSVIVGGNIAGPLGMLCSVPIFSGCYQIAKDINKKRELRFKNDRNC